MSVTPPPGAVSEGGGDAAAGTEGLGDAAAQPPPEAAAEGVCDAAAGSSRRGFW